MEKLRNLICLFIFHIHSAASILRKMTANLRQICFEITICLHNYLYFKEKLQRINLLSWEAAIYITVKHHVTTCREYTELKMILQFSLQAWVETVEN